MNRLIFSLALSMTLFLACANAQEKPNYGYLSLEPDIVTNYIAPSSKKIGYVRVNIELMIENVDMLEIAEHHIPLLRATAIEIFGRQPEEKVKL